MNRVCVVAVLCLGSMAYAVHARDELTTETGVAPRVLLDCRSGWLKEIIEQASQRSGWKVERVPANAHFRFTCMEMPQRAASGYQLRIEVTLTERGKGLVRTRTFVSSGVPSNGTSATELRRLALDIQSNDPVQAAIDALYKEATEYLAAKGGFAHRVNVAAPLQPYVTSIEGSIASIPRVTLVSRSSESGVTVVRVRFPGTAEELAGLVEASLLKIASPPWGFRVETSGSQRIDVE